MSLETAVVLAAGVGSRMKPTQPEARLEPAQRIPAASGIKCLIPVGRPFLEYILDAIAEAGVRRVVVVTGPRQRPLHLFLEQLASVRLEIAVAIQPEPLGTANALLAGEALVADEQFLLVNSDNYFPADVLSALSSLDEPGVVAFSGNALERNPDSNISKDRLRSYAVVTRDSSGYLDSILEKPSQEVFERLRPPALVSMNCWRFPAEIFEACRAITPSVRGEYELPGAVEWTRQAIGVRYRVLVSDAPVLDLSDQRDIEPVTRLLQHREIRL